MTIEIKGQWSSGWQPLVDAFAANFSMGEVGAGVALHYRGELVVNIWAGQRSNKLAGIDWAMFKRTFGVAPNQYLQKGNER